MRVGIVVKFSMFEKLYTKLGGHGLGTVLEVWDLLFILQDTRYDMVDGVFFRKSGAIHESK